MSPLQFGMGFSQSSIQTAINAARTWARTLGERVMVKVDIKNAFGTISRQAIMGGISAYAPLFSKWAACSLHPTSVFCGDSTIEISTGVQQGDPLAPVFFSLGLHPIITEIKDECPEVLVLRRRPLGRATSGSSNSPGQTSIQTCHNWTSPKYK